MGVIVIQSRGVVSTGSDETPDSLNWANISDGNADGRGSNAALTIAGLDTPCVFRAAWTSSSGSPAKGRWVRNGAAVSDYTLTPVDVTISNGQTLSFEMDASYTFPSGNYDNGTVTVTNETDGAASLDTFTFVLNYVYDGSGSGGGSGSIP